MPRRRNTAWPVLAAATGSGNGANAEPTKLSENDPFYLHGADHPGLSLVPYQLTGGGNFLPWKHSLLLALSAKNKLKFIDGSLPKPDLDDDGFIMWKKVNSTVASWILNSLSKELSETFVYTESAQKLWDTLCTRYGENNGPMKYKLKCEIFTLVQGNTTVIEFFNKLTKLWDELACIVPPVQIDGEAGRIVARDDMDDKIVQFLMGLNESYDSIKNQIMMMDPWPTLGKVFSMLLTAKRQRSVSVAFAEKPESGAMAARSYDRSGGAPTWNGGNKNRGSQIRLSKEERAKLVCDHCGGTRHDSSTCFKLHGVPDWFKEMKDKPRTFANNAEFTTYSQMPNPGTDKKVAPTVDFTALMSQLQEIAKHMKGQRSGEAAVNFAQFANFSGTMNNSPIHFALSLFGDEYKDSWIVDTGASKHMCNNQRLMCNLKSLSTKVVVCLPDGKTVDVQQSGDVRISTEIILKDVLYIPSFKYNLLSVSRLCQGSRLKCVFHLSSCLFQDLQTNKVIGEGVLVGNLYVLKNKNAVSSAFNASGVSGFDWHKSL